MAHPNKISLLFLLMLILNYSGLNAQTESEIKIPGTIFLSDETYLHFDDILYIHGFIAPTSRLNRYKAFKVFYDNTIRVISIYSLKLIRVDEFEIDIGQEGVPVVRNSILRVETKSRESFEMPYFELGWILVSAKDEESNKTIEKKIQFVSGRTLNIQKIVFD